MLFTLALYHAPAQAAATENVILRGNLDNARAQFERKGRGHVAFMGGSITEMNGYRPMVMDILTRRFPKTTFTFTDAGISSTCSTTGAFRLQNDVLSKGPVDLFFVEFAVNDDQDAGHSLRDSLRGMEGIVRHLRRHNPRADIVITYFVNPGMRDQLQAGKTPVPIAAHDKVAEHYHVSTIHLAREVAQRIEADSLTWKQFGGTHPAPFGNAIAAKMIDQLMDKAWKTQTPADKVQPHPMPEPIDPLSYEHGRFIDEDSVQMGDGWTHHVPDWNQIKGSCRTRFRDVTMTCATQPGATLKVTFKGTAVGAYLLAGPDAGTLEVTVDGERRPDVQTYHRFSRGLHYPRTVMLATDLPPGEHVLTVRISQKHHPASQGTAARVVRFVAN